jgi:aldehyde:ferredoxin oxidoreductase
MIATGEKMSITQIEGSFPQDPLPTKAEREAFVKNWTSPPDDKFKEYFLNWEKRDVMSSQAFCDIVDWNEAMHYIDDATGLCGFVSSFRGQFGGDVAYNIHNIPELIASATGIEMDKDKLWKVFQRNRTLVRAINARRGLRRKDERPPEDHWAVRNEEMEQKMLDDYYAFKGWNKEGIPTQETLDKLGLDFVSEDFLKRGILTENENISEKDISAAKEKI